MTKEVFYKKVGSRYVPVREYDEELMNSFTKGIHIVMSYPGGRSSRYNIDPDYAAMIAAGRVAEDAISGAIIKAQEMRPQSGRELTPEQHAAWSKFVEVMGDRGRYIEIPSAREAAEAGVKAMMEEAKFLLSDPNVKRAWDHFQLICALTKDSPP